MSSQSQLPIPLDEASEAVSARAAQRTLLAVARPSRPISLRVVGVDERVPLIELSEKAVSLLLDVLAAMAAGRRVAIVPEQDELTTVEAAALLNVSRPYLIKLLDAGAMPYRLVGTHRRIRRDDVMVYREQDDRERDAALDELVRDAQENDMGYPRS